MSNSGVRNKTIHQNQITGEHGAALVKVRAHAMGFLYSPYGPVEAGIDGIIELRDQHTGHVGGQLVAVQVKTTMDGQYTAETDASFEYLCKPEDIAYWQQAKYLTIEPAYLFTRDGIRPDGYAGERISKLKRRENNAALRGQFVMWRYILTGLGQPKAQADLLGDQGAPPVLRFEALDMIELPVSVPDEIWRSRDTFKPQNDDEELPL
jgi:hypothetical protein